MRRALSLLLALATVAGVALGLARLPDALARLELFRVTSVEAAGTRYLAEAEAIATAAVPSGASVWDDLDPVVERLRAHPLIEEARVDRKLPGALVLRIVEREPVALLSGPALVPVDREGRLLPIDPALHRLDLPLVHPDRGDGGATPLTPAELRAVAEEVARLAAAEPDLMMRVSEVAWAGEGSVRIRLSRPGIELRFRAPLSPRRLLEAEAALTDALERRPDAFVHAVDLRFAEQVVVSFSESGRR